jgi:hypothetical protein
MRPISGRYEWLKRVYPRRDQRGAEIVATMLDTSEAHGRPPRMSDVAGVLGHAARFRLGLGPDRFGGQVLELAALPGLVVGSALAVFLLIWGEWIPHHNAAPMGMPASLGTQFGPFATVAPVAYLVWVLSTLYALGAPRHRRPAAAIAVTSVCATLVAGKLVALSPNAALMGTLAALGMPGILASTDLPSARRVAGAFGAGLLAFGLLWWLGVTAFAHIETFYWYGNFALNRGMVWVVLIAMVGTVGLTLSGRRVLAGTVVLLVSPFALCAAGVIVNESGALFVPPGTLTRAWLTVLIATCGLGGLLILWIRDLHRSTKAPISGESQATALG